MDRHSATQMGWELPVGHQCSSCRFRAILQYNPVHEKDISNLAFNHSCLSPAFFSLFISLCRFYTLACSHVPAPRVMASAHKVSTFYHHSNRAGRDKAKVMDSASIHHPQRQNQSSLGRSTVSALICTGYPLMQA